MFHLIVPKSQESDTNSLKVSLSFCVLRWFKIVTLAVNLDRQIQLLTETVDNVMRNWTLSVEIVSKHLFVFQPVPQKDFGQSHVFSELLGPSLEQRIIGSMARYPPRPSGTPPREGIIAFIVFRHLIL